MLHHLAPLVPSRDTSSEPVKRAPAPTPTPKDHNLLVRLEEAHDLFA